MKLTNGVARTILLLKILFLYYLILLEVKARLTIWKTRCFFDFTIQSLVKEVKTVIFESKMSHTGERGQQSVTYYSNGYSMLAKLTLYHPFLLFFAVKKLCQKFVFVDNTRDNKERKENNLLKIIQFYCFTSWYEYVCSCPINSLFYVTNERIKRGKRWVSVLHPHKVVKMLTDWSML